MTSIISGIKIFLGFRKRFEVVESNMSSSSNLNIQGRKNNLNEDMELQGNEVVNVNKGTRRTI
jgi:hypothetical protein